MVRFVIAFDVNEPGSRRGVESQAAIVMTIGEKLFEFSEFFSPRPTLTPQDIQRYALGVAIAFCLLYFAKKCKVH